MIRRLLVPALTLAVLPAVAFAQGGGAPGHLGTPEQQRACRPDVQRFCLDFSSFLLNSFRKIAMRPRTD